MPYFRVDDGFPSHPKVLAIPRRDRPAAVGLWTLAGAWCQHHLTNGRVPAYALEEFAATTKHADLLVTAGLWERTDGGYAFHDWIGWQGASRDEVLAKREAEAERKRRWREQKAAERAAANGHVPNVSQRDTDGTDADVTTGQQRPSASLSRGRPALPYPPLPSPSTTHPVVPFGDNEDGTTSGGDLAEVDARASEPDGRPPDVPDTPPAPLEDQPDDETPPAPVDPADDVRAYEEFVAAARQRTSGPAVHDNAMPPARCRNHLELADPPPCGRCADARRAQDAWIADRDAKVAQARADAQREIREARRLERQQIAGCGRCDERGILPSAVTCTHDERSDPTKVPAGRAEYLAMRAAEKARLAKKAKSDPEKAPPPANGEQLRLIAIRFGEYGVTDRDWRLQVLGELVGRRIGSTRELTRAEASVVLDRFDHPPTDEPPAVLPGDPDYVDAEIVEAEIVLADDEHEDDEHDAVMDDPDFDAGDEDDMPPAADEFDDATGGFEDAYREEQHEWAEADAPADYVYAGDPDVPF